MRGAHRRKPLVVAVVAVLGVLTTPAWSTAASLKQFLAVLNAGQETPPNGSTGTGVAHLTWA